MTQKDRSASIGLFVSYHHIYQINILNLNTYQFLTSKKLIMKKKPINSLLQISLIFLFTILLVSYVPNQNLTTKHAPIDNINKTVEKVFKDSIYKRIFDKDIERLIKSAVDNNTPKQDFSKLVGKNNFSKNDFDIVVKSLGFKNEAEYTSYINLFNKIFQKYNLSSFNESEKKVFFKKLKEKQFETLTYKMFLDYVNNYYGGMPSECWKCVYDYRDCLSPYIGTVMLNISGSITVQLSNGAGNIFMSTFSSGSHTTILYIKNAYTQQQCDAVYRLCIDNCRTP